MKHEMTAREYAKQRARLCSTLDTCRICPLSQAAEIKDVTMGCILFQRDYPDEAVRLVEDWAMEHPEPKPTIFVPDEIVRVTTIEMTQIIPKEFFEVVSNRELTQEEIEGFRSRLRELLKNRYYPDDLRIKVQQFITKGHEEDV